MNSDGKSNETQVRLALSIIAASEAAVDALKVTEIAEVLGSVLGSCVKVARSVAPSSTLRASTLQQDTAGALASVIAGCLSGNQFTADDRAQFEPALRALVAMCSIGLTPIDVPLGQMLEQSEAEQAAASAASRVAQ